jgi:very-short-patch-repair endonuclease
VDFYAPEIRLAIEVDGGQHATAQARDEKRARELGLQGIAVLRFWNIEVMENTAGVLTAIARVIEHLRARTSPLPPLRGGGGSASTDLRALNLRLSLPETAA